MDDDLDPCYIHGGCSHARTTAKAAAEDLLRFRGTDRRGENRAGVVSASMPPAELLNKLAGAGWRRVVLTRDGVEVGRWGHEPYTGRHVSWAEL